MREYMKMKKEEIFLQNSLFYLQLFSVFMKGKEITP